MKIFKKRKKEEEKEFQDNYSRALNQVQDLSE